MLNLLKKIKKILNHDIIIAASNKFKYPVNFFHEFEIRYDETFDLNEITFDNADDKLNELASLVDSTINGDCESYIYLFEEWHYRMCLFVCDMFGCVFVTYIVFCVYVYVCLQYII